MAAEQAPEREQRMWMRVRPSPGAPQPTVICSTLTPFPFWVVVTAIVVFIPLALIASWFVKRQTVVLQGTSVMVLTISFWRYKILDEQIGAELGEVAIELDGKVLVIDGERFHLEPGWLPSAEKLVALNEAAAGTHGRA